MITAAPIEFPSKANTITMPPRTKVAGGLVGFTASDSEPDFDDVLEMKATRSEPPVKRPRGRPPGAAKVTKPAQKQARSASVRPTVRAQASPRRALADKSSNPTTKKAARSGKAQPEDDVDMLDAPHSSPAKPIKAARGRPKGAKEPKEVDSTQEETKQEDPVSDEEPMEIEGDGYQITDVEDGASDATVRRKLGDMTRKYESLEARHRELRQVSVVEAGHNFERLQKQADESAAGKYTPNCPLPSRRC